jgi:hypothetical protein
MRVPTKLQFKQTNTRFAAARDDSLASLPDSATPESRDAALADLYRRWVLQEARRQADYNLEFRRRSAEEIKLALRVHFTRFMQRIGLKRAPKTNWY